MFSHLATSSSLALAAAGSLGATFVLRIMMVFGWVVLLGGQLLLFVWFLRPRLPLLPLLLSSNCLCLRGQWTSRVMRNPPPPRPKTRVSPLHGPAQSYVCPRMGIIASLKLSCTCCQHVLPSPAHHQAVVHDALSGSWHPITTLRLSWLSVPACGRSASIRFATDPARISVWTCTPTTRRLACSHKTPPTPDL